jgi:hypothetical protein
VRMARQHQRGYIFRKGRGWYLRYREPIFQQDGSSELVQRCRKLTDAIGPYRSKKAVQVLADEFLAKMNQDPSSVQSAMMLGQFVEQRYSPYVEEHLPSFDGSRVP